jgi:hypothetical protein
MILTTFEGPGPSARTEGPAVHTTARAPSRHINCFMNSLLMSEDYDDVT